MMKAAQLQQMAQLYGLHLLTMVEVWALRVVAVLWTQWLVSTVCLVVAVPMGTRQLRAILLGQAVSAPAQVRLALPQASKREMAQKERGRQREMSTPATGCTWSD